jgi:SAM-dependent methyltransferase
MRLQSFPRQNHRLLRANELIDDKATDLVVYQCSSCGFISIPANLSDNYYDDYVNVSSLSPSMRAFQQYSARSFVDRFALQQKPTLEIGSGDGFFLKSLNEAGAIAVGIEPSRAQREIAQSLGLTVHDGFLERGRRLSDGGFDAFVTRQVFEHISDMHGFLMAIRDNLKPGAAGMIEVPNLDLLIRDHRFFDFIPEHLNYFSPRSLRLILELSGFEVLDIKEVQDGEAISASVRLIETRQYGFMPDAVSRLRAELSDFIAACRSRGESVAMWGAGGKGVSILAGAGGADIALLVDGDPHKAGLFTPVSHLVVSPPSELRRQKVDVIIITAPAYTKEILRMLRTEYAFTGRVAVIDEGVKELSAGEPRAPG